jgi:hypothetical protein
MPVPPINVNANGKNITVAPTRLYLDGDQGTVQLTWQANGHNVELVNVEFVSGAPITNLGAQSPHQWTGDWDTGVTDSIWKYSVTVKVNGTDLPVLDPEIENGPPGGVDEGECGG